LLELVADCVNVVYILGNHDDIKNREYFDRPIMVGGINICNEWIHTIGEYRLLVIHGDQFDPHMKSWFWGPIGRWVYSLIINIHALLPLVKKSVHIANRKFNHVNRIYDLALDNAAAGCYNGVLCGHSHLPEIIKDECRGIDYFNCGNWVESSTAIVENLDGSLKLIGEY
jgi:UDP-2,3-diacylglucosamine pyrophosphatase LpxH